MVIPMDEFKWSLIRYLSVLLSVPWLWLSSPVSAADYYYRSDIYERSTPEAALTVYLNTNNYYSMYGNTWDGMSCVSGSPFVCTITAHLSNGNTSYPTFKVYEYACTASHKANPNHPCFEPECPDPGTLYSGAVNETGTVGSGYTDSDGCSLSPVWKPTYCDYPGAETEECVVLDGFKYGDPEPPPKICKDDSGRYLGQVSGNAECPSVKRVKCYNVDGTLSYTADSAEQCPGWTSPDNAPDKQTETDSDIDPDTGEPTGQKTENTSSSETTDTQVTQNPDGSTTTTTTTTKTDSNGSTSTSTTTRTENADGSVTETTETEETEVEEAVSIEAGKSCEIADKPKCQGDILQCYQIQMQWYEMCHQDEQIQGYQCDQEFVCSGGPIECFSLELQRERACIMGDSDAAAQAVAEAVQGGQLPSADTDQWGQLGALDAGSVNIEDQFNVGSMWADSGSAGSCPSPIKISVVGKSIDISFEPLCELAGYIRAFVIFMATWISFSMLSQTLIGTRWW